MKDDFRASGLLVPWSGISSNAQGFSSSQGGYLVPSAAEFLKSKAARGGPKAKTVQDTFQRWNNSAFDFACTYEKQTKWKNVRDQLLPCLTYNCFSCVCMCMREFLHSELQAVLILLRFLFGNFVSSSHKQISLVKYIKTED